LSYGRLIRGRLALDWMGYRTVWDDVTGEWHDYTLLREINRSRSYEWRSGLSASLGIEVPVRR
jgi:hypothetical protein